jgi:hypothetical protein
MKDDTTAAAAAGLTPASSKIEAFDLADFEDVETADVRIKNPKTGAPSQMVVTLAGPEHPDRKRIVWNRQRRARAAMVKTGKLPMNDPEDDDQDELELLLACTLGWVGFPLPFNRDNARAAFTDPKRRWLREQVSTALNERELFTKACAGE